MRVSLRSINPLGKMNITRALLLKIAVPVLSGICLCSCKTEQVYFNITEPAYVTVPAYVKKVGIINRSVISDSNSSRKKIDNILSAKGSKVDKDCSYESVRGVRDALIQSNIFQSVVSLDSVKFINSYPASMPPPLSWDQIDEICRSNNVDAIFALELFHTANKLSVAPPPPVGRISPYAVVAVVGSARVGTSINTGWRIYDPQNKMLRDEYLVSDGLNIASAGSSPADIALSVMNHEQEVKGVSYNIGQGYASRIFPYTIRICRDFYIRGSDNLKIARRMADAGDWKGAADLWYKETTNPILKVKARAYYDMAINCEMNGDLDGAIEWAKQSYEIGGKRMALLYLNDLRNRKPDYDLLQAQAHHQ